MAMKKRIKKDAERTPQSNAGVVSVVTQDNETTPAFEPGSEDLKQWQKQHPDDAHMEIAKRSPDTSAVRASVHTKVLVLKVRGFHDDEDFHRAQHEAIRTEALNLGLTPTGDVTFVGAEELPDGKSTRLIYELPVTPSAHAEVEESAVAAADPERQAELTADAERNNDPELPPAETRN